LVFEAELAGGKSLLRLSEPFSKPQTKKKAISSQSKYLDFE
jgi:hypothetical protein